MLQAPSLADDIRDFQIEGISIGDSLLDHFSKKEVKDFFEIKYAVNYYPKSKKFFTLGTFSEGKIYKQILFGLKASDNKYIIKSKKSTGLFHPKQDFECDKVIVSGGVMGSVKLLMECKKRGSLPNLSKHIGNFVRSNSEAIIGVKTQL